MRLFLLLSLSLAFTIQASAFDGHDRGNGGDVLICHDQSGNIKSARFYDLFEAEFKFGFKLTSPTGKNLDEKVQSLISRVESVDPARASVFRFWYSSFFKESQFIAGIELGDVPDHGSAFWPVNCKIAQLVVQTDLRPPLYPHRYTFSLDLWNLLDDDSKAATVLHELTYREARHKQHQSSVAVRYLNGLFWADRLSQMNRLEYQKLILRDLDLQIVSSSFGMPFIGGGYTSLASDVIGMTFSMGGGEFVVERGNAGCLEFIWDKGDCYSSFPLRKTMVKQPWLPEFVKVESLDELNFRAGLYFGGRFKLLAPHQFDFEYLVRNYDNTWEIAERGLLLRMKDSTLFKATYQWSIWKFEDVSDLQVQTRENRVHSLSFKASSEFKMQERYSESHLTCSSQHVIKVQPSKTVGKYDISCVLAEEAYLSPLHASRLTRVKKGKRVLVDGDLRLVKIQ